MNGNIDEVRISNIARSADWIAAEFLTMNNSFISYGAEETINWWDTDWSYRKKLTFNNSDQAETLTNFPVLVNLSSANFDYSKAKSDGSDLCFIDSDGSTELNYEIEDWDTSGSSYVWVNVTGIDGSTTTDHIWMYYGNSAASPGENPTGVWDENYLMVQHFQETDIDGGSGDIKDSTSNDNDGTTSGMDTNDQVPGKIDGSFDLDGSNDYISLEGQDIEDHDYDALTVIAWYKSADSTVGRPVGGPDQASSPTW